MALTRLLSNTWAVELPPEPQWPAIAFDIESVTERGWVQGGGYTQHSITVFLFAKTRAEIARYRPQIVTEMEWINLGPFRYLSQDEHGDAEFEDFPGVYGYFMNFTIRERT